MMYYNNSNTHAFSIPLHVHLPYTYVLCMRKLLIRRFSIHKQANVFPSTHSTLPFIKVNDDLDSR